MPVLATTLAALRLILVCHPSHACAVPIVGAIESIRSDDSTVARASLAGETFCVNAEDSGDATIRVTTSIEIVDVEVVVDSTRPEVLIAPSGPWQTVSTCALLNSKTQ
jgi:hypothetical protein